jgi:hypothetical protein
VYDPSLLALKGQLSAGARTPQVWKRAWFADAAAGATPTIGAEGPLITLNGFVAASWHVPEIRDYVRLLHTPPPQPPSSLRLLRSLDSFLHVSAFRHRQVLGRTLTHLAAAAGITATPLVRSCLAEVGAAGRSGGESVRWYLRALRHMSDGAFDVIEERVRRVLEREVRGVACCALRVRRMCSAICWLGRLQRSEVRSLLRLVCSP